MATNVLSVVAIQNLKAGDAIVENPHTPYAKVTLVKKVDTKSCARHVHINDNDCWDYGYPVSAYLGA